MSIESRQQIGEDPAETRRIEARKESPIDLENKGIRNILKGVFWELAKRPPTEEELEILLDHRESISEFVETAREAASEVGSSVLKDDKVVYQLSRHPTLGGLGKLQNAVGEVASLIFRVIPLEEGQYLWGLHSPTLGIYIEKLDPFLPKDQPVDPCLQALVAMTLQHERVHWLKSIGHFKRDIPFASGIGWIVYHEVLSYKAIDPGPFDCSFEVELGLIWKKSFDYWNDFSGKYIDLLIRESERLAIKYNECDDEPKESYVEGRRLAALALKHFKSPIQALIYLEKMSEGQSAKKALENLQGQLSTNIEGTIRTAMRDNSMWEFMRAATSVSNQIGLKDDKIIRGFFTVNTLDSLESGLSVSAGGIRKIPRFLYLRPPLA